MPTPPVTIVVPSYNRPAFLRHSLPSCRQELAPGVFPEVIVVDDASPDGNAEVVRRDYPWAKLIALETNGGSHAARNRGLAEATGRWVKFLDFDDRLVPGALAQEVAAGDAANADIVVSGADFSYLRPDGSLDPHEHRDAPHFTGEPVDELLAEKGATTGAALYRRELAQQCRWDPAVKKVDDWDFFVQAALKAERFARTDATAYVWVIHGDQQLSRLAGYRQHLSDFYTILGKIEAWCRDRGVLTSARRQALARFMYVELRPLALMDRAWFERVWRQIDALDPGFMPGDTERNPAVRGLCRLLGTRRAVLLYGAVKRWLGRDRYLFGEGQVGHPAAALPRAVVLQS